MAIIKLVDGSTIQVKKTALEIDRIFAKVNPTYIHLIEVGSENKFSLFVDKIIWFK